MPSLKKLSKLFLKISLSSVLLMGMPFFALAQAPVATPPPTALDAKCWTKEECNTFATDKFANAAPGEWGGPNNVCAKTLSGAETGYCYTKGLPVNLNVPILGVTDVSGFPEYLTLAYRFLLPAMSLIAVVMLMVGGLEYTVSGGSSKRVEKAKTRIKNAVIGLILLFSAYAIANLLDPRLVKFGQLRLPLIKTVVVLDPNSSCERLKDYKFDISPSNGTCGKFGKVIGIDNVLPEAKNSNIQIGRECPFITCSNIGAACGSSGECVFCPDVSTLTGVSTIGILPSNASCSLIGQRADEGDPNPKHKYYCEFEAEGGVSTCESAGISRTAPYIDCATVESRAEEAGRADPCSAYDDVVISHRQSLTLQRIDTSIARVGITDVPFASKVCIDDPCGVAAAQNKRCGLAYLSEGAQNATFYTPLTINNITGIFNNACVTVQ